MDLGLKGKAAAVMAGSEGLGRACARALAREGASVAICGRREDVLRSTAKSISDEFGHPVLPIVADVSDPLDVERFVNAAASDLRGLDILVVNAGGPAHGGFDDITDAQWQQGFDLMVMSGVRAIRAALPHFRAKGGGSVIGIQSTSVKQPIENLLLSNALRLSAVGLFKSLALDHGPENIRYNLVLPGAFATDRQRDLLRSQAQQAEISEEEAREKRTRATPLRRMGEPDELGDAVAWLASDRAKYVTGVALQVDGGLVRSPL